MHACRLKTNGVCTFMVLQRFQENLGNEEEGKIMFEVHFSFFSGCGLPFFHFGVCAVPFLRSNQTHAARSRRVKEEVFAFFIHFQCFFDVLPVGILLCVDFMWHVPTKL